jgi:exodeoxyribonuclease V beta subunit
LFDGTLEDSGILFDLAFKTALRRELACEPAAAELLKHWLDHYSDGVEGLESLLSRCHSSRRDVRPAFDPIALRRAIEGCPLAVIERNDPLDGLAAALKSLKVHGNTVKAICNNHLPALCAALDRSAQSLAPMLEDGPRKSLRYLAEKLGGLPLEGAARAIARSIVSLNDRVVPLKAAIVATCLPVVRRVLKHHKAATGAYDFDEMIAGVAGAVMKPDGANLVAALRSRYRYVLIDEFQDTDELQWEVFRRVFVESGGPHRTYLIADPKQAIYGFRGADVHAYLAARAHIVPPGFTPVLLEENHRSTPELIRAYNLILDQRASLPFFDGEHITYDAPVRPGRHLSARNTDGTPSAPVHVLEVVPKEESLGIDELRRGLARQIAREASLLLSNEHGLRFGNPGSEKWVTPGDVFVLTATNRDAQQVAVELRNAGVPFAFYKQEGLFQTAEALAVRDLLAAIDNPADPARRGRAWISPFFSVPLSVLPDLAEIPDWHPLVQRLSAWKDLAERGRFETLFSRILDDSGVALRKLLLKDDERALTNYFHLFEILLEHARATGHGLTELVATLDGYVRGTRKPPDEDGDVQRLESDRDAVQIMSIHKSKGLEAAVVFVYGGFTAFPSDGLYEYHDVEAQRVLDIEPSEDAKTLAERERKQEQQRLYYVALTRAKARLYLPFVPTAFWSSRWDGGYRQVNDRLSAVLDGPESAGHFIRKRFGDEPVRGGLVDSGARIRPPEDWRTPAGDLADRDDSGAFAGLRERHRAYEVTSYSRMKQAWAGATAAPIDLSEFRGDSGRGTDLGLLSAGQLPGGRVAGTLLHEILEAVPLDETASAPDLDSWRAIDAVTGAVDAALTRSATNPVFRADAEALVYCALTTEIPIGPGRSIPGLCRCLRSVREMEFLFPIPEAAHPRLSDPDPGKLVIERGFVKGFVDLVVEHEGLVYFADWKGDVLDSYEPRALGTYVAEQYELQAKLYVLAVVKALHIHSQVEYDARFGGMIYVFLRGLRQPGAVGSGVHFSRPEWSEVLEYEVELITLSEQPRGGSR